MLHNSTRSQGCLVCHFLVSCSTRISYLCVSLKIDLLVIIWWIAVIVCYIYWTIQAENILIWHRKTLNDLHGTRSCQLRTRSSDSVVCLALHSFWTQTYTRTLVAPLQQISVFYVSSEQFQINMAPSDRTKVQLCNGFPFFACVSEARILRICQAVSWTSVFCQHFLSTLEGGVRNVCACTLHVVDRWPLTWMAWGYMHLLVSYLSYRN